MEQKELVSRRTVKRARKDAREEQEAEARGQRLAEIERVKAEAKQEAQVELEQAKAEVMKVKAGTRIAVRDGPLHEERSCKHMNMTVDDDDGCGSVVHNDDDNDGGDDGCDDVVHDDVLLVTMMMMLVMMMMSMAMMVLMMMDIYRQRTHPVMSDSLIPITLM